MCVASVVVALCCAVAAAAQQRVNVTCEAECDYYNSESLCCFSDGTQVSYEQRIDHGRRLLHSELCQCRTGRDHSRVAFRYSLIIVSIFALVVMVSALLFYFTKHLRRPPSLASDDDGASGQDDDGASGQDGDVEAPRYERSSSLQQLVELVYSRKILESKAALIRAFPPEEGARCAVCLEELADDDLVRPPTCPHVYHRRCITEWIDRVAPPRRHEAADVTPAALEHPERTHRPLTCPICAVPIAPASLGASPAGLFAVPVTAPVGGGIHDDDVVVQVYNLDDDHSFHDEANEANFGDETRTGESQRWPSTDGPEPES